MNRNSLKTYAPQARRDFIQAMKTRAAFYGITETKITPMQVKGDVVVIGGREHPMAIAGKRQKLEGRIARSGYEQTMEALAYTWFNRFAAIRFMEVNGYLDHGYRVLSHPQGKEFPEILEHADEVVLPGLSSAVVRKLKIEGNRERDIYRMTLVAQCNALNAAMPFLFEKIDNETELLLPDNLLNSDSIVGKLVSEIEEKDWRQIEIIGWLYQFYISEKKDQVIGKVVKSEDIPAATQLFTPNWIVKYMVQNSLGAMWLATYPDSSIKAGMKYFVPPAEQTPEVVAQIAAETPKEIDPEKITVFDPAIGSGHIVVETYDLLLAIYMDRGYQKRDAVRSILTKNLFGLDIDDRAAQLAGFALLMKARADDRTILKNPPKLNIRAVQDSAGVDADAIADALLAADAKFELLPAGDLMPETLPQPTLALCRDDRRIRNAIKSIVALFEDAKTFGSLLTVPEAITASLSDLETLVARPIAGDLFAQQAQNEAHDQLAPLVSQARILSNQYDCVVANPPYMGGKGMNLRLREFAQTMYPDSKSDLYACFMQRNAVSAKPNGFVGMITIPNWMFLSGFDALRASFLRDNSISSLIYNGRGVFGSDFGSCAFVFKASKLLKYKGSYRRLFEKQGSVSSNKELQERFFTATTYTQCSADFALVPGAPIVFTLSKSWLNAFEVYPNLDSVADICAGLSTGDNTIFQRYWHETDVSKINFEITDRLELREQSGKWVPCNSGGNFRKWYGNQEIVVDWQNDGAAIRSFGADSGRIRSAVRNDEYYGKSGITWSKISIGAFAARSVPSGFIFDDTGRMIFPNNLTQSQIVGWLCTRVVSELLAVLAPSASFTSGDLKKLPVPHTFPHESDEIATEAISISKIDWDSFETSWGFQELPSLSHKGATIKASQEKADKECLARFARMKELEELNNDLFISLYGLHDELISAVPDEQITLYTPSIQDDIKRIVSFSIGCMMGRFSLDKPGLIYARSGNQSFDATAYQMFGANDDGMVLLLDRDWGLDDAAIRLAEFICIAWPKEHLEENLKFVADSLGANNGEEPRETIRRYLISGFYKHHLSAYKRRPIYWLFSSGKERAFQCLVYLHRYDESTLARMRITYVVPLQGKIASRIEQLDDDISMASSTAHRRKLQKELDDLKKQLVELNVFEEKLRHYAEMQIALDLDEGVKVNYGKFGDLLADAKMICGGKDDE